MDWRINNIQITNFKFFKEPFKLDLNGKHLLMYGENGSGKSSIYWAFYTLFQSCYKIPTKEGAQKYFEHDNPENLRNKFSTDKDPSSLIIELISSSGIVKRYEDSNSICNTHVPGDTLMSLSAGSSDFLNYKFLSEVLDFKNSEENNIFSIVERDIFPSMICSTNFSVKHVQSDEQKPLEYWWRYINTRPDSLPRNARSVQQFSQSAQEYWEFQSLIDDFNKELYFQLQQLEAEANKKLSKSFNIPVKITLTPTKVVFNKKKVGTTKGYDGIVHKPHITINAMMTNEALPNGPVAIEHPKSFFNEAKLTCIALAFRLAAVELRYKGSDAVSALFIDDLLISLDMGRRLQVIDVILELRHKHQLVIFTHDRAFFDIISTKIESLPNKEIDKWEQKEIYAQDENMCFNRIPSHFMQTKSDYIEHAISNLYRCDLPACANYLRKAAEHELKRLLPSNWVQTTTRVNEKGLSIEHSEKSDLSGMIQRLPLYYEMYGLPYKHSNLDIHRRRLLNPMSHDDLLTPIYRYELQDCILEIQRLQSIVREKDVFSQEQIQNNLYYIDHINPSNGRHAKVVFRFCEVFEHIKVSEIIDGIKVEKRYHKNSMIELLYSNCSNIFSDEPDENHYINGLIPLILQFLAYKNGDEKPTFDDIVRPYSKNEMIGDIIQGLTIINKKQ